LFLGQTIDIISLAGIGVIVLAALRVRR